MRNPSIVEGDPMSEQLETELRQGLHRSVATINDRTPPRDGLFDDLRRRRRRRAAGASVAAVVVAIGLVVGFGAVRRSSIVESVDTAAPATNVLAGASATSWLRLLGRVPRMAASRSGSGSGSGSHSLSVVDLARARQQAGVASLPNRPSDADVTAQLTMLFGAGNVPPIEPEGPTPEQLRSELGFSHDQIDQVISGFASPRGFVAVGRFDPSQIADAVKADPVWGPRLETRTHRGITYYRWAGTAR